MLSRTISNCCACDSKDVTVESWGKDNCFFATIRCERCGRERTTKSNISEDDAIHFIINKWNDECDYYRYANSLVKAPTYRR